MNKGSWSVAFAFLQTLPPSEQNALLRYLPQESQKSYHKTQKWYQDPTVDTAPLEEELPHVHFSWLEPYVRALPKTDIKLALSCLTQEQQKGLKRSLRFSNHLPELTLLGALFLKRQLFSALRNGEDLLQIATLPDSPMNLLLNLSYEQLCSLISLLAMHDLSGEIRQIIDTTQLKKIYAALTTEQSELLNKLTFRKEGVTFKKMELSKWDGQLETLHALLEQRGINRLAKALYEENPSLLWILMHRLDADRGAQLRQLCAPLDHPRAASLLSEQVVLLASDIHHGN
jgi:hypothetical protein